MKLKNQVRPSWAKGQQGQVINGPGLRHSKCICYVLQVIIWDVMQISSTISGQIIAPDRGFQPDHSTGSAVWQQLHHFIKASLVSILVSAGTEGSFNGRLVNSWCLFLAFNSTSCTYEDVPNRSGLSLVDLNFQWSTSCFRDVAAVVSCWLSLWPL